MARGGTLDIELRATGVAHVEGALNRVGKTGGDMGRRVGLAGRQMASALENAARSGRLAGESLKQIVQSGAEMAFMFGAGGAAAGAVVIGVLAIAQAFKKAKEEAIEARSEIFKTINAIAERPEGIGKDVLDRQRAQIEVEITTQQAVVDRYKEQIALAAKGGVVNKTLTDNYKEQVRILTDLQVRLTAIDVAYANLGQKADEQREIDRRREARIAKPVVPGVPQPNIPGMGNIADLIVPKGEVPRIEVPMVVVPKPEVDKSAAQLEIEKLIADVSQMIEATFEDGIANAFQRAFSGEGWAGLFKGFGQTVLAGLGQVFIEIGKSLIAFGSIMEKVKAAILSGPFGAGIGAIVAGAALIALGGAMAAAAGGVGGGSMSMRGGGMGGVAQQSESVTRIIVDPTQAQSASKITPQQPVQVVYMGRNADPSFENWLAERVNGAVRRGSKVDGGKGVR